MSDLIQVTAGALTNAAIYALIAFSLVLVYRSSGVVNFGVGFLAVFVGISFANGSGGWGGFAVSLCIAVALGVAYYAAAVAIPTSRGAPHATLAISTLGAGLVVDYFSQTLWPRQGFTADPLWSG